MEDVACLSYGSHLSPNYPEDNRQNWTAELLQAIHNPAGMHRISGPRPDALLSPIPPSPPA